MFSSGKFTIDQIEALKEAVELGGTDPSYHSGQEGIGPIENFEQAMAEYLKVNHVLSVSSCTAAIHTALLCNGIGPGDEVIVTPYSWGQSVAPVLFTGATPVFADIEPDSLCIDHKSIEERISDKTKAIIPVHIFGRVADLESISRVIKDTDISIISDSAHALGIDTFSEMSWRHISCFSLGRGKLISGGEGGLFATNDSRVYEKALCMTQHSNRVKREFGYNSPYDLDDIAYNYRMHPLAAVLGLVDLKKANVRLKHRRLIWNSFKKGLFESLKNCVVEIYTPSSKDSWAAYGIPLIFNGEFELFRALIGLSQDQNIPLRIGPVETPLHIKINQPKTFYKAAPHRTHKKGACPVAEKHCSRIGLWAMSPLDMDEMTSDYALELGKKLKTVLNNIKRI